MTNPLSTGKMRTFALLSLFVGLLLLNGLAIFRMFEQVSDNQNIVFHTGQVLMQLERIQNSVVDMETGQRGYLLIRKTEFLAPYESGKSRYEEDLRRLREMVSDNPNQAREAETLTAMVRARIDHLTKVLEESIPTSKFDRERQSSRLGEGRELMEQIRNQIRKMEDEERHLLARRTESVEKVRGIFILAVICTTLLSILAAAVAARQIRRNQSRLEQDALEREVAVQVRDLLSEVERSVAGNLSQVDLAKNVLQFLGRQNSLVAARFFGMQDGAPFPLAAYGADTREFDGSVRSLVHEAVEKKELYWLKDVPENYWQVGSALGSARPNQIAFLPMQFQGRRLGVIEMAFFAPPEPIFAEVLEKMASIVSVGMSSALSRDELQHLLEKTQQQAEELEAQQEELRASNEELEQQARALESQQQSLNFKNRELEESRKSLEIKARDLQLSTQYKSDFLAKMSHELRTPLNGLLILSTLLIENKEKNLTEQQKQFAKSIHTAGNDLLMLINDILDLSKIEARKLSLRPESFHLSALTQSLSSSFTPQAEAKNLELQVQIPEELARADLHTDRHRLEQILRNFLSNALKFTEKGFVRIEARADGDHHLELAVQDSGIGIPPDKRQLVFQAFEQADGSISRKFGGTGLGLTISKELAALLGGEIALESEVGKGSRFALRIPRNIGSENRPASMSLVPAPIPAAAPAQGETREMHVRVRELLDQLDPQKKTILIVEDDEKFLQSVSEVARSYGFDVIPARDGETAAAILNVKAPDAILLDIKLPGISGLGLLEMIKHSSRLRHIPVHMISGLEYQHSSLRMGALGYLTKPVNMDKIRSALGRIEKLLRERMRRILLIEDDERQRMAITNLIAGADVQIDSAETAAAALKHLHDSTYDCIILDLSLPDMTGFDFLAELNALSISVPPIVIYTAKDLSGQEEDYLRQYSESIIIKGARSPERLLDEVNLFLHRVESMLPSAQRELLSQLREQKNDFDGKTVLVVDDDLRNVFALTSALESKNLNVRIAKDGIEALEALDKDDAVDLVLMDIMMPRMDGFETMRRMRKDSREKVRRLPIIALTAKAMREDHEKCIEAGANDYIPKPVDLNHLTTVLKVWLSPKGIFQ